jgi:18S rRNA (guanine1575-N7)-methyltransferase
VDCCCSACLIVSIPAGKKKQQGSGAQLKTKSWILKKKAQMRTKGYTSIPVDTKYTGRKRKKGF